MHILFYWEKGTVGDSRVGLHSILYPLQILKDFGVDGRLVGAATWDVAPGCDPLKYSIADQWAP
jgi:hypothetical protein